MTLALPVTGTGLEVPPELDQLQETLRGNCSVVGEGLGCLGRFRLDCGPFLHCRALQYCECWVTVTTGYQDTAGCQLPSAGIQPPP